MGLERESGFSTYHHLLHRTEGSSLQAAKILFFLLLVFIPDVLLVDEMLESRRGK